MRSASPHRQAKLAAESAAESVAESVAEFGSVAGREPAAIGRPTGAWPRFKAATARYRNSVAFNVAAALGAFGALFLCSSVALLLIVEDLRSHLRMIAEDHLPISVAAFEMEINAVGTGLGVAKYLSRPDPAFRARFEGEQEDFRRFYRTFATLAASPTQQAHARDIERAYDAFAALGGDLMAGRDSWSASHARLVDDLAKLGSLVGPSARGAPGDLDHDLHTLSHPLAAELNTLLALLHRTSPVDAGQHAAAIAASARDLRSLAATATPAWIPEKWRPWFESVRQTTARIVDQVAGLAVISRDLDDGLTRFVVLRNRIDDLLDEEIQIIAGADLAAAQADADFGADLALWSVVGAIVGGMALLVAFFRHLSAKLIVPLRRITESTDLFGAGDMDYRLDDRYQGELGHLARAFNDLAERVSSGYRRLTETNAQLDGEVRARTQNLADANERLEGELALRKRTEAELEAAMFTANAANHAKTMFLANMSHELRTPLNAVIGFSDLLRHAPGDPLLQSKSREYLADISQSGAHLLRLINDLLDVSRIELGEIEIADETLDLADVLAYTERILEQPAREKAVALSFAPLPALPALHGDPARMRQILINVVGNAVKFTPSGGSVDVSCAASAAGVTIVVADSGIGMSEETLRTAFEPFGQAEEAHNRHHDGAGLGLPLAKWLVERHGGTIAIASTPGAGTAVTLHFPTDRCLPAGDHRMTATAL